MNAIFQRISVRKYQPRPVEPEKIEKILRAAMAAPSAGNQQPWEFYVVRNPSVIQELAECSPYAGCAASAPVVIVPCLKMDGLHFPELGEIDLPLQQRTSFWRLPSWAWAVCGWLSLPFRSAWRKPTLPWASATDSAPSP
jgi:nitroreductase